MTDDDEELTPLVLAAIGSVLLVIAGGVTFATGLLSPLVTDGCGSDSDYGPGGAPYCRNSETVTRMLTVPVLLVVPAGLLFTWLRFAPPYRPRAWVPLLGLLVLGVLWFAGDSLMAGRLF